VSLPRGSYRKRAQDGLNFPSRNITDIAVSVQVHAKRYFSTKGRGGGNVNSGTLRRNFVSRGRNFVREPFRFAARLWITPIEIRSVSLNGSNRDAGV